MTLWKCARAGKPKLSTNCRANKLKCSQIYNDDDADDHDDDNKKPPIRLLKHLNGLLETLCWPVTIVFIQAWRATSTNGKKTRAKKRIFWQILFVFCCCKLYMYRVQTLHLESQMVTFCDNLTETRVNALHMASSMLHCVPPDNSFYHIRQIMNGFMWGGMILLLKTMNQL